jgi:outer membrane lipoprotein carrier protein
MMRKTFLYPSMATLLLGLLVATPGFAADPHVRLAAFTRDLTGLSGQFEQRVFDPEGRLNESSQGQIALAVPRQFRWEYVEPFPQLIVADGDKVWIFDPDLEQVQVRPQGAEEQQSPLTALVDPAELDRQFELADGGEADGLDWVELRPRGEDAPFSRARLGFAGDELLRMDMVDALAQRTQVRFSDWQRNPVFAPGTFHFVPPAGVDVIGEVDDAAQAFPLGD